MRNNDRLVFVYEIEVFHITSCIEEQGTRGCMTQSPTPTHVCGAFYRTFTGSAGRFIVPYLHLQSTTCGVWPSEQLRKLGKISTLCNYPDKFNQYWNWSLRRCGVWPSSGGMASCRCYNSR